MSLLLEALKKAEKAKEEAQRRAREGEAGRGEPQAENAPEAKPVLTRAELPDIRQPLEILSDDIAPKQPQASSPAPQPAARQAEPRAAEPRAQAKKVFEAKIREPNPRLPFYITLAALGLFAIGTVVYFWMQLRPPTLLVNPNPGRPPAEASTPVAQAKPAGEAPAPSPAAPSAAIPGLPTGTPPQVPAAPAAPSASTPAAAGAAPVAAAPKPEAPKPEAPKPQAAATPQLATRPVRQAEPAAPPQVHPKVETAYAAYQAGDLTAARNEYQQALREDPANRDALLGLAATEVRAGRYEVAEAVYLRLLQSDPRDAYAQAGLLALRSARMDPIATESRVKSLLAADPAAHVLHFTLGNQLAQQGRWAEAQQEYFKAFAAEPDNPDFAYNLAVSLDQLRQPKLALDYYRRAIALAEKRSASFDRAAAQERASQLSK